MSAYLRWVDDGRELLHSKHSQIRNGECATLRETIEQRVGGPPAYLPCLEFVRLQLVFSSSFRQTNNVFVDGFETLGRQKTTSCSFFSRQSTLPSASNTIGVIRPESVATATLISTLW